MLIDWGFGEYGRWQAVNFIATMTRLYHLQCWRVVFVLAALLGLGSSSLLACKCTAQKRDNARASYCKARNASSGRCCGKNAPAKHFAEKGCCRIICCKLGKNQDRIVTNNPPAQSITHNCSCRWFSVRDPRGHDKPLCRTEILSPCPVTLCVFLC